MLLEWIQYRQNFDIAENYPILFTRLEDLIDALLPLQRKRFTKDMLENADLWVRYLFERSQSLLTANESERALALLLLLESYIGPKAPTNQPNKHEFFSLNDDYQLILFKEVLNYQYPVNLTQYDYSTLYYALYWANYSSGHLDQAIVQLGIANSWNPVSLPILLAIADFFKEKKVPDRLEMVAKFAANIAITFDDLGAALRYVGFSYYLNGKHEKAYACYYQSLRYGGDTKGVSNEINAILLAMGKEKTYQLARRELRDLFAGEDFFPEVSKNALRALKRTIITNYEEEAYTEVIRFAQIYLKLKSDATITKLMNRAIEHLD